MRKILILFFIVIGVFAKDSYSQKQVLNQKEWDRLMNNESRIPKNQKQLKWDDLKSTFDKKGKMSLDKNGAIIFKEK